MTANQQKAVRLAERLLTRVQEIHCLADTDWGLLVLAAGCAGQRVEVDRLIAAVLANARTERGYFDSRRPN